MIIAISGLPGSGKSTAAKMVAEQLGYKLISTGDLRGKIAQERGMTIDELNALNEPWTHYAVDDEVKRIGATEDNIVFDSWLAWYFVPSAKKIFLKVDSYVAAQRVFAKQRPDEAHHETIEGVQRMLENRVKEWSSQIKRLYGVDFLDERNYDLVLDTTNTTVEECANKILDFVQ